MAVAGDPKNRIGIAVAKNELAKRFGVKTTDTVWATKWKCPGIVFIPPRGGLYEEIIVCVNEMYHAYSDYVEPASIDESFLKDILWPLPVSNLIFAGRAMVKLLHKKNIRTIGDLAQRSQGELIQLLGKNGGLLCGYANGNDQEPVRRYGKEEMARSVSRGTIFRRNLLTKSEVYMR